MKGNRDVEKEKVTIIVPVYNTYCYLKKCVQSLINQTYDNTFILLVDDGSDTETYTMCDSLKQKYGDKIDVIHKKNGGPSSAKNRGIDVANTEYIVFVDSDDYIGKNYIADLVKAQKNNNADLAIMGYTVCYEKDNTQLNVLPKGEGDHLNVDDAIRMMGTDGILNVDVSKLYDTKIIKENNIRFPENISTGEDLVFNCNYLSYINKVAVVSKSNYYYMRREIESLVNKYRDDTFEIAIYLLDKVKQLYNSLDMNLEIDVVNLSNYYCDYMVSCVSNLYRRTSRLNAKKRRKKLSEIFEYTKKTDIRKTNRNNKFCLIFLFLYTRNVYWSEKLYSLLFWFRNTFSKLYVFYRNKVVFTSEKNDENK